MLIIQSHAMSCNEHTVFCEPSGHCLLKYTHGMVILESFWVNVNRKRGCYHIIVIKQGPVGMGVG